MRVFLCILVVVLAACTRAGSPVAPKSDTLAIALTREPLSLNPLYLEGEVGYWISEFGFSYLTNYDSDGRIVADLVAVVPSVANGGISADGRRVTYRLRHGILWQDGVPLTARDVLFTYRAIVSPANTIPSRYGYDRVASVAAPDLYTVVVTLRQPYSPIVSYFFGGDSNYPVLPAHLLSRYASLDRVEYNSAPVGSGPYRFARWARGDRLDLAANPRYYAGKAGIDRIALHFVHDSSTAINQLQTGEIDATFGADVARIATLQTIPGHRIVVTPVPYFYALSFNMTDPVVSDPAIRRAFAAAIDRNALVTKVTHGLYNAETGARGLFTWAFAPRVGAVPFDPQAAAAELARDGWRAGPDGILVKNGQRLEIQLASYAGEQVESEFVALIAAQERAVGIDVTNKRYTWEQYRSSEGPLALGRYQTALTKYQSSYDPDVSWLLACSQRQPHGFNDARYCNATLDAALELGIASFDRATRARAYAIVQRQIRTDLPYDFICQISEIDVIPSRLQGYDRPLLSPFTSVARWHYAP
jgi:peptide/nickel transport system substrate-binding protein